VLSNHNKLLQYFVPFHIDERIANFISFNLTILDGNILEMDLMMESINKLYNLLYLIIDQQRRFTPETSVCD